MNKTIFISMLVVLLIAIAAYMYYNKTSEIITNGLDLREYITPVSETAPEVIIGSTTEPVFIGSETVPEVPEVEVERFMCDQKGDCTFNK